MELVKDHSRQIEKLSAIVYLVLIIILVIFKKEWVLSAIIGALTALINFRVQVTGLNSLAAGKSTFYITANFYLRTLIIGAVLFLSFNKQGINPYVVFGFLVCFQFFVLLSGFFKTK